MIPPLRILAPDHLGEARYAPLVTYQFDMNAKDVGLWNCAIRIIPQNPALPHDLDFNLVKWM